MYAVVTMRGRRSRNKDTEKYVANRQGLYLGMSPDEVLKLIDSKGGDYYKLDLYPDQKIIQEAEGDFNTFRTGTPAMNIVAEDMRQFYGLTPAKVLIQPEVAAEIQRQDYVNNTLGYDVQKKYKSLVQDNDDVDHLEMALLLAAALGTGGVIKGVAKEDEEKKLSELRPS